MQKHIIHGVRKTLFVNNPTPKGRGLEQSSSLIDQTKCFEHYVIKEYIGTVGCTLQSDALRYVIKQF